MAVVGGEGDKANVTGKDLAAALAPERGRGPVLNKEVVSIKERYIRDQGKSVFEADLAQNPEDLMVNFDEMRRVLDSEGKRVDAEKDPKKKDVLKKRYDRLELRFNIYDKLLNNEGFSAMDGAEQQELINTMSALPGFAEAASVAIGGRLSTDQMMKVLSGKGGVAVTRDEKKALSEIIVSMANDDRFKNRVSKSLSTNVMDENDHTSVTKIEGLRIKQKQDEQDEKDLDKFKRVKKDYESIKSEDEIENLREKYEVLQRTISRISDENYRPVSFEDTEIKTKVKAVEDQISGITATSIVTMVGGIPTNTTGFTPEQQALKSQLSGYLSSLKSVESSVGGNGQALTEFKKYSDSLAKIKKFDDSATDRNTRLQELTQEEGKRSKHLDKYKRKMEVALSEEMKRYWNEVSLANASRAAKAQAAIKGEEEKVAEDLKVERVKIAEDLLERFTHLSYMKYEGGEAKGIDDAALKQFVKKDMLSRSPKQLSRDILDRIIRNRGQLPRAYGKEIDGLLKKMGVGEGAPPATARDVLNAIDASEYQKWAELKIPDVMGYARGQGYYFDQLKLKPGQAEFIRRAYPEGFFEKAAAAKEKYEAQAAQLMGGEFKDFVTDGALNWKKVKEALAGKNWKEGMNKLMKYTAYLGAGYVLGGGLMFDGTKYIGAQRVLNTLSNLGRLGTATAGAVSTAGEWVINAPTVAAGNLLSQIPPIRTPDPSELVARAVTKTAAVTGVMHSQ